MEQTAVEFLSEKYMYVTWLRNRDEISANWADNLRAQYLQQAKEMFEEQIRTDFADGKWDGKDRDIDSRQYYNETYNIEIK